MILRIFYWNCIFTKFILDLLSNLINVAPEISSLFNKFWILQHNVLDLFRDPLQKPSLSFTYVNSYHTLPNQVSYISFKL